MFYDTVKYNHKFLKLLYIIFLFGSNRTIKKKFDEISMLSLAV